MLTDPTTIGMGELRRVAHLLLAYTADRHGDSVSVPHDYFWSVPPLDIFDLANQPGLTMGSLEETWQQLTEMAADDSRMVGYGLVWLADVLRAIATETP